MSDFDRVIDAARDEEYSPQQPAPAVAGAWEPLPPHLPIWTPDAAAPLKSPGPLPGLMVSAGVEDGSGTPLMMPQEQKQRADEAALVAHGGQFTGDRAPSWSQSHMTKDPPPHQAFGDAFDDFHGHVTDVQQDYADTLHYPAGIAGMVATGAVAIEDFAQGMVNTVHGASDHLESTMEAVRPIREGEHASAIRAFEEGSKAAGGVGQSVLDVTSIGAPIEGVATGLGGGFSPAPAFAYAADGATEIDASGASEALEPALDGALERRYKPTVQADAGRNGMPARRAEIGSGKQSELTDSEKVRGQKQEQLEDSATPHDPIKRQLPYAPIGESEMSAIGQKLEDRTMTRDEYDRMNWDRRLTNRRNRGVARARAAEIEAVQNGEQGSRNWSEQQRQQLMDGETPTDSDGDPIQGHHKYNVNDYPQKAAEPGNIYQATKREHLYRWHGGNWQNETVGEPLDPSYPEEQ